MDTIDTKDISAALKAVGIRPGDSVYVQSDLRTPGWIRGVKSRDAFCQAYYDAIREIIGDAGTLVVPTYTTQVARYDMDFIWEETPSLLGIFTEFVRTRPDSLRSLHPLHSLCAIGPEKEFICSDNGTSDFGWDSPPHRMLQKKVKIVSIGLESGYAVGIAHHLDAACNLPHVYNKLLKWSPIVRGVRDPRHYVAVVRYLYLGVRIELTRFVRHMRRKGGLRSARIGGSWVHTTDYEETFFEGTRVLRDDPSFMLEKPPQFEYGRIPFDGPTAGADGIGKALDGQRSLNWGGYYLAGKAYAGDDTDDLGDL